MTTTKNIIFDLGGVLINIDYALTLKAFEELGYKDFEEMYGQYTADNLFSDLEKGNVSKEEFFHKMKQKGPAGITTEAICKAWNAMLLDFRTESLQFLNKISTKKNIYLLSNTNEIHLQEAHKIYEQQTGKNDLNSYFKIPWYSNEIGLRKPGKEVFEFVLRDAGIKAEETLFIDDSYNNIETAVNLGFKTHLLVAGEKIEDLSYD